MSTVFVFVLFCFVLLLCDVLWAFENQRQKYMTSSDRNRHSWQVLQYSRSLIFWSLSFWFLSYGSNSQNNFMINFLMAI